MGDLAGARHVVGDGDGGDAGVLDEADDKIVDNVRADRIEAGRRLVEEEDFGSRRDGAGEGDALLHAAGKLGRAEVEDVAAETDALQILFRDGPHPGRILKATLRQAEGDVAPDRQ